MIPEIIGGRIAGSAWIVGSREEMNRRLQEQSKLKMREDVELRKAN
jgi:hypothetical protein